MRTLRQAKSLSQEQLADLCGLHRTYIGSVERAERNISIDNMERIAEALKTSLADLLVAVH
ncbi:MAG: helix-turn-helix domain-containing protein [Planctomycetota bacterium]|jgi:transcriptional regulator with XRE-family HTH domain